MMAAPALWNRYPRVFRAESFFVLFKVALMTFFYGLADVS